MKRNDRQDMQTKEIGELRKLLAETRAELLKLQLDNSLHKLQNTRALFMTRKKIAIIQTILRGKEMPSGIA